MQILNETGSNDNDYPYHQDPDFYYLTGFTEPNSLLIISKEKISCNEVSANEFLFVQNKNPKKEVWTGRRAGTEGAKSVSGVQTIFYSSLFGPLFTFPKNCTILYMKLPSGVVDDKLDAADLYDLVEQFKTKSFFPPEKGDDYKLRKALSTLREVKTPEEIAIMKKSIDITCKGHIHMMESAKAGMSEYQIQAAGEFTFANEGAEDVGYPSICGSRENSVILHYNSNRRPTVAGELILLDMGAEYHGYSSDVTRTIPVSGKFTEDQKQLYEIVLTAQEAGIAECQPGNDFKAPHKAAQKVIEEGLLRLGIIQKKEDYANYFMHGTSHYLGLDVHDLGNYGPLKAGNVITVEPGIYIPENSPCDPKWWNIGIRIEDDILITVGGHENLSAAAPRKLPK
ncbi:MAG: aminopeptidase P family protein [Bacteroidetes bacterium]|nr:aminopeptidase P family protein [Bacteroidota bacterium]